MGRCALAALLVTAGVSHLSWARTEFRAQVPGWVPGDVDRVVLVSGVVEIALGLLLLGRRKSSTGWIVAAFFAAVFPGNVAQLVGHKDAFGLNSDTRRAVRLLFQPVLAAWAVWSTSARVTSADHSVTPVPPLAASAETNVAGDDPVVNQRGKQ